MPAPSPARRRTAAVVASSAAALLLLAGCGPKGQSEAEPAPQPASTSTTSSPTAAPTDTQTQRIAAAITNCRDVTFIGARGSGQADAAGSIEGFGDQVSAVVEVAAGQLSHRTTVNYIPLVYPAQDALVGNATLVYNDGVRVGVERATDLVVDVSRRCPDTAIFLVGYSQGAQVMHKAAAALTDEQAAQVSGVALIADPLRNIADPNVHTRDHVLDPRTGTAAVRDGLLGAGPLFENRLGGRVLSFCVPSDLICQNPDDAIVAAAVGLAVHTDSYQTTALALPVGNWIFSRLTRDGVD